MTLTLQACHLLYSPETHVCGVPTLKIQPVILGEDDRFS